MRDVAIIGIGHTKFGKADKNQLELFGDVRQRRWKTQTWTEKR